MTTTWWDRHLGGGGPGREEAGRIARTATPSWWCCSCGRRATWERSWTPARPPTRSGIGGVARGARACPSRHGWSRQGVKRTVWSAENLGRDHRGGQPGREGSWWRVKDSVPNLVLRHAPCSVTSSTRGALSEMPGELGLRRNARTAMTRRCRSGSSVRPSLWNIELMCFSTARSERNSAFAIEALFMPWARETDLAFPVGELGERRVREAVLAATSCSTTLGRGRCAAGDLVQRPDELVEVGDPSFSK